MPKFVDQAEFERLQKRVNDLEAWKLKVDQKLSFLDRIVIEGQGKITVSGANTTLNASIDTKTILNGMLTKAEKDAVLAHVNA